MSRRIIISLPYWPGRRLRRKKTARECRTFHRLPRPFRRGVQSSRASRGARPLAISGPAGSEHFVQKANITRRQIFIEMIAPVGSGRKAIEKPSFENADSSGFSTESDWFLKVYNRCISGKRPLLQSRCCRRIDHLNSVGLPSHIIRDTATPWFAGGRGHSVCGKHKRNTYLS
jgi:hypothetical protein